MSQSRATKQIDLSLAVLGDTVVPGTLTERTETILLMFSGNIEVKEESASHTQRGEEKREEREKRR